MGRPHFYVVVADDEIESPKTSAGMVNFRVEIAAYRYINADPGRLGMPQVVPYDFFQSSHRRAANGGCSMVC